MTSARDIILERVRTAPRATGTRPEVPRDYRRGHPGDPKRLMELLEQRLQDYGAVVARCSPSDLPGLISERLRARQATSLVIPPDLPVSWLDPASVQGVEVTRDQDPDVLSHEDLSQVDAFLSGCALAIAETGTLVLDGGGLQGRRALSLLPDYHLCVAYSHQIMESVPQAIQALRVPGRDSLPAITLISGPSATSDIELIRVEGVHGPRTLDVILVEIVETS